MIIGPAEPHPRILPPHFPSYASPHSNPWYPRSSKSGVPSAPPTTPPIVSGFAQSICAVSGPSL